MMVRLNDNFKTLPESYLFSEVGKRIKEFRESNPGLEVIRMDIGDVTLPLAPVVVSSMREAVEEMGKSETFRGYGPEQGYFFLREAISKGDYKEKGLDINPSEIFISDGAKSDLGNLGDILAPQATIAIADPSYPAYMDTAAIDGRAGNLVDGRWSNLIYLECRPENNFLPELPVERPDVVILCYPNNPTGVSMPKTELRRWIDYARQNGILVIFDSAYEAFVTTPTSVRSVYEAEGAQEVAIEVRSFSKTAGFTGMRCGYTVVPDALKGMFADGSQGSLNRLWNRRQCTKFNGASYIVQKGAAALYSTEGKEEIRKNIEYYLANALNIRKALEETGFEVSGGVDSPYVWAKHPKISDSWELFNYLLKECGVSVTPGIGFGLRGEGYIRLTGFNTKEKTREALHSIRNKMKV